MGFGEDIQESVGKAKENVGKALGNEELRQEGTRDRVEANAKELGDKVAEQFGDAKEAVADKLEDITGRLTGKNEDN